MDQDLHLPVLMIFMLMIQVKRGDLYEIFYGSNRIFEIEHIELVKLFAEIVLVPPWNLL